MGPQKKLESSAKVIEKELNADPQQRLRMLEARFLAGGLSDSNSRKRGEAREKLLKLGRAAVPALLSSLQDANANVRWQAAKALSLLHDPGTTTDLMNAMEDDDFGVRWLAAEGLIAMGPASLEVLVQGLISCFDSIRIREGSRHVLRVLVDNGYTDESIEKLLHALQGLGPSEEVAWAAEAAREKIKRMDH
ncbi:MAG: HEAT repeat domain-containing protein [Anaerolineales bacterium]